jgi:hypothetical protein
VNHKKTLIEEREKEVKAQMQSKPKINKNTDKLLGLQTRK